MLNRSRRLISVMTILILAGALSVDGQGRNDFGQFWGSRYKRPAAQARGPRPWSDVDRSRSQARGPVRHWNRIAIDTSGIDHTPVGDDETRVFGEQLGPGRSARAMAIVHIAMFETLNSIEGGYQSYLRVGSAPRGTQPESALAVAAHDTLIALYPSQTPRLDIELARSLDAIRSSPAKDAGKALGRRVAQRIMATRAADGADTLDPHVGTEFPTSDAPGSWRQDPISHHPLALGAYWGATSPFVIEGANQFRTPAPPAMASAEYTDAFNEVKRLGGDGVTTPTVRTAEQTQIGVFWAYDGTPSLCAPPRLYNQVALTIADEMGTNGLELARLLALVNVAMADAGLASWESKYFYQFWRPVTGIREADVGTGPSGLGDGNPDTLGDPTFSPLGAPASNLNGPNFTPPFPAYPSGHAVFGGALFQTLRRFYRTDRIPFSFVSDEFNGVTRDNAGQVRPVVRRRFATLTQAEEENGQSRIYLGIHWAFDKNDGIAQGRQVADYVFTHAFRPAR